MTVQIIQGDALEVLRGLPAESVNCCVTSPPYWGLRDYGVRGQRGLEKTPADYVAGMGEVFREVRRVLTTDGTLWLNLGDSYAGSWGNYGGKNRGSGTQRDVLRGSQVDNAAYDGLEEWRPPASWTKDTGLKPKDLVGIPWMVAFALQADGWYLRQDIIWHKPNPMPESVQDRCTKAHEYIFLLSKSERYYYNSAAIMEPSRYATDPRANNGRHTYDGKRQGDDGTGQEAFVSIADERNKRSVWTVTTKPYKAAHFATFPPDLIKPCILAGCPEGGTVLDPFLGSGTTALVAQNNGCNCIGIELNPEYVKLAKRRIQQRSLLA